MGDRSTGKKDNNSKSGKQARAQEAKREQALERQEARSARSTKEQLTLLDSRPGESKKERARLG